MDKRIEGNICMGVSKSFSALNVNALKYLVPLWMAPLTGVALRAIFGAVFFWIIGYFMKDTAKTTSEDKWKMFLLGFFCFTGYQVPYLIGIKYTTPAAACILASLVPLWVFIYALVTRKDNLTWMKGAGLVIGLSGAYVYMLSKNDSSLASNPMLGNSLMIVNSIGYAVYLILSDNLLKRVSVFSLMKWSFLGSAFSSTICAIIPGWYSPVLDFPVPFTAFSVLLFVLFLATGAAYLLLPFGLKNLNTTVVAMWGYWEVVITVIVGIWIGQDRFDWLIVISVICLCLGLYMVERGEVKNGTTRPSAHKLSPTPPK